MNVFNKNHFEYWMMKNGVEKQYKSYLKDIEDIRNGVLGKSWKIINKHAKDVFQDTGMINILRDNNLYQFDFFNHDEIKTLIEKLELFDELFFIQKKSQKFVEYNKKVSNYRPRAAIRKYIKYLEENYMKKDSFNTNSDNSSGIINTQTNISIPLNQILYGPPGTGKTYHTINKAIQIIDGDNNIDNRNRNELKKRFKELTDKKQIVFTTFHQSMSYEEFIEGLKPYEKNGNIHYKVEAGIFKQICQNAEKFPERNYVLIIDEINRGNIAGIFGELITLIEPDKRKGAEEELSAKLPYSKDEFTIPKNLYIIGTMNTADRSVEALDSALRRRFVFEEMPPDSNLLEPDFKGINLRKLLSTINVRIEKLIDKDHKIGHSYFMNLSSIEDLQNAFKNKLIPLLEEYFYGDFVKIGLILGNSFIDIVDNNENIFKTIDSTEDYSDFESRILYNIIVPENESEFYEAVISIYSNEKK